MAAAGGGPPRRLRGWLAVGLGLTTGMAMALGGRVIRLTPAACAVDPQGLPSCAEPIAAAISQCRTSTEPCIVELAEGDYRVPCPQGVVRRTAAQIEHPAILLDGVSNMTFGGSSSASGVKRPQLLIDYRSSGCAGIVIQDSKNVTVQSVVVDAYRLPFTVGNVLSVSGCFAPSQVVRIPSDRSLNFDAACSAPKAGPTTVAFALERDAADRLEIYRWNTTEYPWLELCETDAVVPVGDRATRELPSTGICPGWDAGANRSMSAFNSSVSSDGTTVTIRFSTASASRAKLQPGDRIFIKHYGNSQSWGIHGRNVSQSLTVNSSTLLSISGMGFRADFCAGEYSLLNSEVALKSGTRRPMSITADGTHWMHHAGPIVMKNTSVQGQGDDGFNIHGNFIIATRRLGTSSVTYINERGSGWIEDAPTFMIGDPVAFYSRRTLQRLGQSTITAASRKTVSFADPIPAQFKRFDMFLSLKRIASLSMTDCFFGNSNSRGIVLSAVNATIERTTFANLSNNGIAIIEGGCGCTAADYTEGPFSQNVFIRDCSFDSVSTVSRRQQDLVINNIAALQVTGCHPIGVCGLAGNSPSLKLPSMPLELSGSTLRIVQFSVPAAIRLQAVKFYVGEKGHSLPLRGVGMAIYSSTYVGANGAVLPTNHPTSRLALINETGAFVRGDDDWWSSRIDIELPNGTYYLAHNFGASGPHWQTTAALGGTSKMWPRQTGFPVDMVQNWSVWQSEERATPIAADWVPIDDWCDPGGTLPPPFTPNNADDPIHGWIGGHLTEPGADLLGRTFTNNITIERNEFIAPRSDPFGKPWRNNFVNVGGVKGLILRGNSWIRRAAPDNRSGADAVLYSNTDLLIQDNTCSLLEPGFPARVEPCTIRNASTCNVPVNKC